MLEMKKLRLRSVNLPKSTWVLSWTKQAQVFRFPRLGFPADMLSLPASLGPRTTEPSACSFWVKLDPAWSFPPLSPDCFDFYTFMSLDSSKLSISILYDKIPPLVLYNFLREESRIVPIRHKIRLSH